VLQILNPAAPPDKPLSRLNVYPNVHHLLSCWSWFRSLHESLLAIQKKKVLPFLKHINQAIGVSCLKITGIVLHIIIFKPRASFPPKKAKMVRSRKEC
jgi:hypothetical protein